MSSTTRPRSSRIRKHGIVGGGLSTCGYQKCGSLMYPALPTPANLVVSVGERAAPGACRLSAASSRRSASFSSSSGSTEGAAVPTERMRGSQTAERRERTCSGWAPRRTRPGEGARLGSLRATPHARFAAAPRIAIAARGLSPARKGCAAAEVAGRLSAAPSDEADRELIDGAEGLLHYWTAVTRIRPLHIVLAC